MRTRERKVKVGVEEKYRGTGVEDKKKKTRKKAMVNERKIPGVKLRCCVGVRERDGSGGVREDGLQGE